MNADLTGPGGETGHDEPRVDYHLEKALALSDNREVNYHLREALHLLGT